MLMKYTIPLLTDFNRFIQCLLNTKYSGKYYRNYKDRITLSVANVLRKENLDNVGFYNLS